MKVARTVRRGAFGKAPDYQVARRVPTLHFIGAILPDEIAALIGPQDNPGEQETSGHAASPATTVPSFRETYQARVLRRFAEQFQADLDRITRCPALPAVATIRLDDPWA